MAGFLDQLKANYQKQGGFEGLLGSPMLNVGLGLLGASQGRAYGEAAPNPFEAIQGGLLQSKQLQDKFALQKAAKAQMQNGGAAGAGQPTVPGVPQMSPAAPPPNPFALQGGGAMAAGVGNLPPSVAQAVQGLNPMQIESFLNTAEGAALLQQAGKSGAGSAPANPNAPTQAGPDINQLALATLAYGTPQQQTAALSTLVNNRGVTLDNARGIAREEGLAERFDRRLDQDREQFKARREDVRDSREFQRTLEDDKFKRQQEWDVRMAGLQHSLRTEQAATSANLSQQAKAADFAREEVPKLRSEYDNLSALEEDLTVALKLTQDSGPGDMGPIADLFPNFTDSTQKLDALYTSLGIGRLDAFKGALSEKEMKAAFSAGASLDKDRQPNVDLLEKQLKVVRQQRERVLQRFMEHGGGAGVVGDVSFKVVGTP